MRKFNTILITGGCGFIGSNFIRYLFKDTSFKGNIINIDLLTYAGDKSNLSDIEENYAHRYVFIKADIQDEKIISSIFNIYNPDCIIHFAAESHVDRSIKEPFKFIMTNVYGTQVLLDVAKNYWKDRKDVLFHHISTDEVFGILEKDCKDTFTEESLYNPRSPYSASKASSDHFVMAYYNTYGLPITMSNCSNNYGPYQYPEKLIPMCISKIINNEKIPIHGRGEAIRDWLFVKDHCKAIWKIVCEGNIGEKYNIGGETEKQNIEIVNMIVKYIFMYQGKNYRINELIDFVEDRPGQDQRYGIDCTKIKDTLGWKPETNLYVGLQYTIEWYFNHKEWLKNKR